jgi:hypothetical protein
VPANANLPVFHSMLPGSAMGSLSSVMHQRVSAISTARIQRTCINSDPQLNAQCSLDSRLTESYPETSFETIPLHKPHTESRDPRNVSIPY